MKIIFLFILLFFIEVSAQRFNITGTVTDSAGIPLSGVNIFITETDFGTASDNDGNYIIQRLKPGKYTLNYSRVGFKLVTISDIRIINNSVVQNVQMQSQAVLTREVIITAGKHQQILEDLSESAEIIPAEVFTRRNFTTLEDAMRYVPGVIMTDDQISIRGSTGYGRGAGTRVLLALDGIPLYTGDSGQIIWEILPISEIERVEVLKGSASSLYGSSAIGGVVNVITKRTSNEPFTHVKTHYGFYGKPSHDEWDWSEEYRSFNGLSISHSNRIDDLGFTLSLSRIQNLGYQQSGFVTRYIGYLKTIYNISPISSLTFFVNSLNQNSGNFIYWKDLQNALVPPDEDQGQRVKSDRYMFGLIYKHLFSSSFYINIRSSFYRTNWEDESVSRNTSLANLLRNELQTNLSLTDNTLLISGVELVFNKIRSNIFSNAESEGVGLYSQLEHRFDVPLTVTAGFRYDNNKINEFDAASSFSPKAGINYKFSDQIILRASAGRGFRAPSLAEMFTSTTTSGVTIRPNTSLKSETSTSFEAGVLFKINEHIFLDAALFRSEYYDFIEPELRVDDEGNSYGIFDNITRARIQGFEFNQDYYLIENDLHISLSYTFLNTKDLNTEKSLRYRPKHLAMMNTSYKFHNFESGISFRYWSKVEEIDFELIKLVPIKGGEKIVDVYVLDFSLGYNLISHGIPGKLFFNTKNLLNYNYVELIGNLAPIRNYSINAEIFF